jgi:hypothetical protein
MAKESVTLLLAVGVAGFALIAGLWLFSKPDHLLLKAGVFGFSEGVVVDVTR